MGIGQATSEIRNRERKKRRRGRRERQREGQEGEEEKPQPLAGLLNRSEAALTYLQFQNNTLTECLQILALLTRKFKSKKGKQNFKYSECCPGSRKVLPRAFLCPPLLQHFLSFLGSQEGIHKDTVWDRYHSPCFTVHSFKPRKNPRM